MCDKHLLCFGDFCKCSILTFGITLKRHVFTMFFFYFSGVRTLYWKKMRTSLHDSFWTLKLVIYSPLFIFRKRKKKTDLLVLHFFGVTFIVTRTHITTVYHYFSFLFFQFKFVYLYLFIYICIFEPLSELISFAKCP